MHVCALVCFNGLLRTVHLQKCLYTSCVQWNFVQNTSKNNISEKRKPVILIIKVIKDRCQNAVYLGMLSAITAESIIEATKYTRGQ